MGRLRLMTSFMIRCQQMASSYVHPATHVRVQQGSEILQGRLKGISAKELNRLEVLGRVLDRVTVITDSSGGIP